MLSNSTLRTIDGYWAAHFGCPRDVLFKTPIQILTHGKELADYHGVYALFRAGAMVASLPPEQAEALRPLLASLPPNCSAERLAVALQTESVAVIGPAYIGYAESFAEGANPARTLSSTDAPALNALQEAFRTEEWDHGGSPIDQPCSGVFDGDRLVALAGYEIWGDTIAHISIITHPEFRRRGFGRNAVAHLAQRALTSGLLPQYRALEANRPSIRLAASLGFQGYATSMAIRLR